MDLRSRVLLAAFLGLGRLGTAFAEEIPLKNWTVPQYSLGGLGKAVDVTPPRAFIGVAPCRVIDTRGGAPLGGGIFANSEARDYTITRVCGIPFGTDAVSVNFTVTGSPAAPPGAFLLAYPMGSPPSPVVSILNFQAGQTIANAAIVPVEFLGRITINVSHSTHVIMDINGYFSDMIGSPNTFQLFSSAQPVMHLRSQATACQNCGLLVETSANPGFSTILNSIHGVYSGVVEGAGVQGSSSGAGSFAAGVLGLRTSGPGVGAGVMGYASCPSCPGVRGTSDGNAGVGVRGQGGAGGYGVFFAGGLGGTGTKSFIEPHPTDPALAIKYVSLEGPEAGTYFRGRSRFTRGIARIPVPETFRMVTAEEGLSIQVTPIGEMATVAVVRIDLKEIVVKGSRNVEFFYTVNGVRRAYKNWDPIVSSTMAFRPSSPEEPIPDNLSEDERARLIANGTYTKEGKVNLETARKLGWDKDWKTPLK